MKEKEKMAEKLSDVKVELDPELKEIIDSFFHNETLEEREEKIVNKIIDILEDGEVPIYRVPTILENVEKKIYSAVVKLASISQ